VGEKRVKGDGPFWYCVTQIEDETCPEGKYKVVDGDN
jgi:hypothetical protein